MMVMAGTPAATPRAAEGVGRAPGAAGRRAMDAGGRGGALETYVDEGWSTLLRLGFEPYQRALVQEAERLIRDGPTAEAVASGKAPAGSRAPGSPVSSGGGGGGGGEAAAADETPGGRGAVQRLSPSSASSASSVVEEDGDGTGLSSVTTALDLPRPRGVFTRATWAQLYRAVVHMCTRPGPGVLKTVLYARVQQQLVAFCMESVLPAIRQRTARIEAEMSSVGMEVDGGTSPARPTRRRESVRASAERRRAHATAAVAAEPEALSILHDADAETLLRTSVVWWNAYRRLLEWVQHMFCYLDRFHTEQDKGPPKLQQVGHDVFWEVVLNQTKQPIRSAVLSLVERDRRGEVVDRGLIRCAAEVFMTLNLKAVYVVDLETPYLDAMRRFYRRESAHWAAHDTLAQFLQRAEAALEREDHLARSILHASSLAKVHEVIDTEVLRAHQASMLAQERTGFAALLEQGEAEHLRRAFRLYRRETLGGGGATDGSGRHATPTRPHRDAALAPLAAIFAENARHKGEQAIERALEMLGTPSAKTGTEGGGAGTEEAEGTAAASAKKRHADGSEKQDAAAAAEPDPESIDRAGDWLIGQLIELRTHHYHVMADCFDNHDAFRAELRSAFETVANASLGTLSVVELLTGYVDRLLRSSSSSSSGGGAAANRLSEEEAQAQFRRITAFLEHMHNKDVFAEFYRNYLYKRLLFGKSVSEELEHAFVAELKRANGNFFTAKLEGMLRDLDISRQHQNQFGEWRTALLAGGIDGASETARVNAAACVPDFSVTVLNWGSWPSFQNDSELLLPHRLTASVDTFKTFYEWKHQHRFLRWYHSLGTGVVECSRAAFPAMRAFDKVDVVLSTYQMCVLLLFEENDSLTFEQIQSALNVTTPALVTQLKRYALSLCTRKYRFLIKTPAAAQVKPTDAFQLNRAFEPAQRRIRIPVSLGSISNEEREVARGNVQEDRRMAIDAAIVRIMKSHKQLTHQQLMAETSQQIMATFKPDPRLIKERIEDLILREYLERDTSNTSLYRYIA